MMAMTLSMAIMLMAVDMDKFDCTGCAIVVKSSVQSFWLEDAQYSEYGLRGRLPAKVTHEEFACSGTLTGKLTPDEVKALAFERRVVGPLKLKPGSIDWVEFLFASRLDLGKQRITVGTIKLNCVLSVPDQREKLAADCKAFKAKIANKRITDLTVGDSERIRSCKSEGYW